MITSKSLDNIGELRYLRTLTEPPNFDINLLNNMEKAGYADERERKQEYISLGIGQWS